MGYEKKSRMERLKQEQDRGYCAPENRFVCSSCVNDKFLSAALKRESRGAFCSYCKENKAAPITVLLDEIRDAIYDRYADPADELPYDSSEGGYQGTVIDTHDLFESELHEWTRCHELWEDAIAAFSGAEWCKKNYFGTDRFDALRYGWDHFVTEIKYRTRYLFFEDSDQDRDLGIISPARMLDELRKLFNEFDLFREFRKGDECIRARVVPRGECPSTVAQLGAPPREYATYSNRMSPAGISMFYAALDERTAFLETYDPKGEGKDKVIVLARFRAMRTLRLLDFTSLPELPSYFDRENRWKMDPIRFLCDLRADLAKPISKDGLEHIEYVPTQVITEYVRHRLRNKGNDTIDGILYPSSKAVGREVVVFFADNDDCGPRSNQTGGKTTCLDLLDYRCAEPADFLSMRELARSQNVSPMTNVEELMGTWPGDGDDEFDVAIDELRHETKEAHL